MKSKLSRNEAREKVVEYFKRKELDALGVRKIKRIAMKHNIKLGAYRKRFCKKCFSDLKSGKIRVTKMYKNIECPKCGIRNRWRIK